MRYRHVLWPVLALTLGLAAPVAALDLPPSVDGGASVEVRFDPVPAGAGLRVLPITGLAGAEQVSGPPLHSQSLPEGAERATITAPEAAGSYIVVIETAGRERERAFLEVVATPVARFGVPREARAAEPFEVTLAGQGRAGDRVVIEDTATGTVISERGLTAEEAASGRITVIAPGRSGRYRLRYVQSGSGASVGSGIFTVDATKAIVTGPGVVAAGEVFELGRVGPGGAGHAVRIETEASETVRELSLAGSEGAQDRFTMQAPDRAGRYLIRYVSLTDGALLSETPLIVTAN